jgi:hypothetical protein
MESIFGRSAEQKWGSRGPAFNVTGSRTKCFVWVTTDTPIACARGWSVRTCPRSEM